MEFRCVWDFVQGLGQLRTDVQIFHPHRQRFDVMSSVFAPRLEQVLSCAAEETTAAQRHASRDVASISSPGVSTSAARFSADVLQAGGLQPEAILDSEIKIV